MKLVTEVVTRAHELSKAGKPVEELKELLLGSPFSDALEQKLKEMEAAGKLGLLYYAGHLPQDRWQVLTDDGQHVVRVKVFIYLLLESWA